MNVSYNLLEQSLIIITRFPLVMQIVNCLSFLNIIIFYIKIICI